MITATLSKSDWELILDIMQNQFIQSRTAGYRERSEVFHAMADREKKMHQTAG